MIFSSLVKHKYSANNQQTVTNYNLILSKNLVIIPTYNEKENIEKMIATVLSLSVPFNLLVVDDGSPDGTATLVKNQQANYAGRLHLIERQGKLGLGTAYIRGFEWGLERGYDYIFEMDCDFSHHPTDLVRLYKVLAEKGGDVAVGSRYVPGGKLENWPCGKNLASSSS